MKTFVMLMQLMTGAGYALDASSYTECQQLMRREKARQEAAGLIVAHAGCYPRALVIHAAGR